MCTLNLLYVHVHMSSSDFTAGSPTGTPAAGSAYTLRYSSLYKSDLKNCKRMQSAFFATDARRVARPAHVRIYLGHVVTAARPLRGTEVRLFGPADEHARRTTVRRPPPLAAHSPSVLGRVPLRRTRGATRHIALPASKSPRTLSASLSHHAKTTRPEGRNRTHRRL